jgi:hypothetical protein
MNAVDDFMAKRPIKTSRIPFPFHSYLKYSDTNNALTVTNITTTFGLAANCSRSSRSSSGGDRVLVSGGGGNNR